MIGRKEKGSAADMLGRYELIMKLQKVVIVCLTVFLLVLAGLSAYLGSLPKSVPWVIELSRDGQATYYPDAVQLLENWTPNDATQRYFMRDFVQRMRTVSIDNYRNQENAASVFSKTLYQAVSKIESWYMANNPIQLSAQQYTQVPDEEVSITKLSDTQWRVSWRETTYRRSDNRIMGDAQYEGVFTIAFYTPETERQRIDNPIGMYVTDFDISLMRNLI